MNTIYIVYSRQLMLPHQPSGSEQRDNTKEMVMKSGLSSAQGKTWPLRLGVWLCGAEQMYAALSSFFHTEHETASDYTVSESQPVSFSQGGMVSISSGGGWGQAASPWSLVSGWDSNPHFSLDLDNEVKTPTGVICALWFCCPELTSVSSSHPVFIHLSSCQQTENF